MYLFDTDILSQIAKKRRPESLMSRLARTPLASQHTSAVNALPSRENKRFPVIPKRSLSGRPRHRPGGRAF
jgi:predicted nucleic acid-binding protein